MKKITKTEQQLMDELKAVRALKHSQRRAYNELIDGMMPELQTILLDVSRELSYAKREIFRQVKAALALKYELYETSGEEQKAQQSHTFSTGDFTLTIGYRVVEHWDDTAHEGVAKVKAYISSLAKDADSAVLVKTVFRLLRQDKNGNLKANRVLELEKIAREINNAELSDGVSIILDAYKPRPTCWYIEAYTLNERREKVNVPLSISAADFPDGFEFSF